MAQITIEGSITPAAGLARGERRTVQDTPKVRAYVAKGFAIIVDEPETPAAEPDTDLTPYTTATPPRRNASREDWAEFLAARTDIVTEGRDRDELIAAWDAWNQPPADD